MVQTRGVEIDRLGDSGKRGRLVSIVIDLLASFTVKA